MMPPTLVGHPVLYTHGVRPSADYSYIVPLLWLRLVFDANSGVETLV